MRSADEERFREFARGQTALMRRSAFLLCGDWHRAELSVVAPPDVVDDHADPARHQLHDELRGELFDALVAVPPRQRSTLGSPGSRR